MIWLSEFLYRNKSKYKILEHLSVKQFEDRKNSNAH